MAYLIVSTGLNRGVVCRLGIDAVTLGRDPSCSLPLLDDAASRRHAEIAPKDGAYELRDLESKNLTYVNGIPCRGRKLVDGDRIQVGATVLAFLDGEPGSTATRTAGSATRTVRIDDQPLAPATGSDDDVIVGRSPAMKKIFDLVRRVADADAPVLIQGETGTGKEGIARAIHRESRRRRGPFEILNGAALPEPLAESELFGHEKGAFTGATADTPGRFELADGGTLFLDEVGEVPAGVQAKLLRVLENGEVRRVGGASDRRVDVRLICATNRDLAQEAKQGRFRKDLYYRLKVVEISLPPLRDRGDDVREIARYYVDLFRRRLGKSRLDFAPEVEEAFARYVWPGNVRELRNVMERAAILSEGPALTLADLPFEMGPGVGDGEALGTLKAIEDRYIRRVLQTVQGNKKEAAKILGIDRSTLYDRLKQMGIGEPH